MKIGYKHKWVKSLVVFLVVILFITVSWTILSFYQLSRYDVKNYNCRNMSYDCAKIFKQMGIPTKVVYGSNNNSAHCWVRLWNWIDFESTNLLPDIFGRNVNRYKVGYIDNLEETK